jgi:uncharacterized phage-associated protein
MISYQFDKEKAINALLFISQKICDANGYADKYATLKILYFAEKKHLVNYGRLITDDKFAALKFGPVPSSSYDILDNNAENFTQISKAEVKPIGELNLKKLSKSDINCLKESIEENRGLSFTALKRKSHDEAYHKAFDNSFQWISLEDIATQEGVDANILAYIREHYEMQNFAKCLRA